MRKSNSKTTQWAGKIKALRWNRRLTQESLARALDVDKSAVSGWEQGRFEPSLKTLISLVGLSNSEDALWFLDRVGIDRTRILSAAAHIFRERNVYLSPHQMASVPEMEVAPAEVTTEQAARILNANSRQVLKLIKSEKVKARRIGRLYLIRFDSLMDVRQRLMEMLKWERKTVSQKKRGGKK